MKLCYAILALGLTACRGPSLYHVEDFPKMIAYMKTPDEVEAEQRGRDLSRETIHELMNLTMSFQTALRLRQWDKALSFCTKPVQDYARQYQTSRAFFKDVIPWWFIGGQMDFECTSTATFGKFGTDSKVEIYFCKCYPPTGGLNTTFSWEFRILRYDEGLSMSFTPSPYKMILDWLSQKPNNQLPPRWRSRPWEKVQGLEEFGYPPRE